MTDTTERYHGGNKFSTAANKKTGHNKEKDFARIKDFVRSQKRGATSYEVEVALDMRHQTCSARFTDLKTEKHKHFLRPLLNGAGTQVTRPTDTGSPAGVWIAVE